MDMEAYIEQHIDAEPDYLAHIDREAHVMLLNPRMSAGHVQGRLLRMLAHMIRPYRILEIGTFVGYSALCMAEALPPDGRLHTIEVDDELEDRIRENLALSEHGKKIVLHIGDALEVIPQLDERFDLVYIDADKRDYVAYYHAVFDKLNPGAFILADNTLWGGKIVQALERGDKQTAEIQHFNEMIAADSRVEKVILPVRDGLTIIRKL